MPGWIADRIEWMVNLGWAVFVIPPIIVARRRPRKTKDEVYHIANRSRQGQKAKLSESFCSIQTTTVSLEYKTEKSPAYIISRNFEPHLTSKNRTQIHAGLFGN